ncbi:8288_t:CDS:1 [Ambispora leptoticha]|uniref:8288_t:CDS:1 n=1 Tax=Ambispora leptoticha TaxID=144679 RepID=A0A9N9D1C8_9GLOM|nr:8288_t:CDS:1 [Ambispora leptoticha]
MSRSSYQLTRREIQGLIDIDQISKKRYDYSLILICSRLLYRIQLKCYLQDGIKDSEINEIVTRETVLIQRLNLLKGLDAGIIFDYCNQLTSAEKPLEIMRSMLTGEDHSREASKVKRIYKNLVTLIDDLQIAKNMPPEQRDASNSKRYLFRQINFAITDSLISEDKAFIEPPLPLVWLPTLTNREKVTQSKTSAFSLRKRKEFTTSGKFRNRLLRMSHVQAIIENSRAFDATSSGNAISLRKKKRIEKPQRKSIIIDIEEYKHANRPSSFEPKANMENKQDVMSIEFLVSNSVIQTPDPLPSISNVLSNALLSNHRSAFTRILPKNTLPRGYMQCCNHNLKKNLRQLCSCIPINAPRTSF